MRKIIVTALLALSLTACGSRSIAAGTEGHPVVSRADWENAVPLAAQPMKVFEAQAYHPAMPSFANKPLVVSGEVLGVGKTDEGGYVVYLVDNGAQHDRGSVAIVVRKTAVHAALPMPTVGSWVQLPCTSGAYIKKKEFACVFVEVK